MIVVDTTVLVYAVGIDHPLREPCRAVITALQNDTLVASTTIEVIQEFCHVRARRCGRADAVELAQSYADLFAPLLTLDADDLRNGLQLFRKVEAIGTSDAILAAATTRANATGFISADSGFAAVRGLRHLDPARPEFMDELERRPPS